MKLQWHAWYWVVALFGIVFLQLLWVFNQDVAVIPYSLFLSDLKAD